MQMLIVLLMARMTLPPTARTDRAASEVAVR